VPGAWLETLREFVPFTFRHLPMLALLLLLPLLLIIWRLAGKRLVVPVLLLRLLLVALLVLALADPIVSTEPPTSSAPLLILVDQSESLTPEGQTLLRERAFSLARTEIAANQNKEEPRPVEVLWFGNHVLVANEGGEGRLETLDTSGTSIAQALRTAREMLRTGGGEVVLLSDGLQTSGDALNEARQLAAAGVSVDVWPIDAALAPEARIVSMRSPPSLRVGEEYAVQIGIEWRPPPDPNAAAAATSEVILQLWESSSADPGEERLLAEEPILLEPGIGSYTFRGSANESGVLRLRANLLRADNTNDTFAQNNQGATTTLVALQPRVLIVEGQERNSEDLASALWRANIESEVIPAQRLPERLSELQWYNGMVLVDVSAHDLSLGQMSSVKEFVRSEGRGLLVTGGTSGYSLGGYKDTPLEDVLPINLDPPPRPQRSNVALLLMVDRSASMSIPVEVSKFDMAKEAAILSTEMLQSDDKIGILSFDTGQDWTIPFQPIGQGLTQKQIQDTIVMLNVGGGTDIYGALDMGLPALMNQQADVRHAVLLTDGRSFTNDMHAYEQLVTTALNYDVTLSAIAIGMDADTDLLNQLADWGNGRYYFADDVEDIPRLTLQESDIARSDPVVEGIIRPEPAALHPLLNDIAVSELPDLQGYVATSERPGAEVVLRATGADPTQTDPILATWQYGTGRVVAWMPSVGDPWATGWPDWGSYGPFWSQIVRYTLPEPDSGQVQIAFEPRPEGARMVVDAFRTSNQPLNLADSAARITMPDGTQHTIALRQAAPGRYIQDLLLPAPGAYAVEVGLGDEEGTTYHAEAGYAHPVSPEYATDQGYVPPYAERGSYPQGGALLERIAEMTGGEVVSDDLVERVAQEQAEAAAEENSASEGEQANSLVDWLLTGLDTLAHHSWPWLIGMALVVWMLEVAAQRRMTYR
jgi:uncharacterized membrane protein